MTGTIVFGLIAILLLALCTLLLDELTEAWRLEAQRAQAAADLANKLASEKDREIARLLEVHRRDAGKIVRFAIEIERLERRQLVSQVFPKLALHSGQA